MKELQGCRVKGKRERKGRKKSKLKNTSEKQHIGDKKQTNKTTQLNIIYDIKEAIKHLSQVM